jgi:ATP-dependent RNA helicase DDX24/MAK5
VSLVLLVIAFASHGPVPEETDIPDINIDLYMLDKLKARIHLAKQVDSAQHKVRKEKHEKNWLKEAAEAMDIELDSDLARLVQSLQNHSRRLKPRGSGAEDFSHAGSTKRERKNASAKTAALKLELGRLLAQPLISQGVSTRYITSGSKPIAHELLAGESGFQPTWRVSHLMYTFFFCTGHESMVGMKKTGAGTDLEPSKKKRVVKRQPSEERYDEWSGFEMEAC